MIKSKTGTSYIYDMPLCRDEWELGIRVDCKMGEERAMGLIPLSEIRIGGLVRKH